MKQPDQQKIISDLGTKIRLLTLAGWTCYALSGPLAYKSIVSDAVKPDFIRNYAPLLMNAEDSQQKGTNGFLGFISGTMFAMGSLNLIYAYDRKNALKIEQERKEANK